jgi:hypothetical protein
MSGGEISNAKFQTPIKFQYPKSKLQVNAETPRPLRGHSCTAGELKRASLTQRNKEAKDFFVSHVSSSRKENRSGVWLPLNNSPAVKGWRGATG